MQEIRITDIENIRIGQTENAQAGTGCTVVICEKGAPVGLDVRGGGPASRETELAKPLAHADKMHAVLLSGGSAYGLDAAGGVMQYLEEHGIGLSVGPVIVPLVMQSDIFDLTVGDSRVRPDKAMGYQACVNAEAGNYRDGNYGAGTGATVGKVCGMGRCMKAGIGSYAVQIGKLKVGAIVSVNALGDIFDHRNGQKVAGLLNETKDGFCSAVEELYKRFTPAEGTLTDNTTIGIIITNGAFPKTDLCKIAGMAHNGYARAINPVHTSGDGDSIYAMSVGNVEANKDMVGTLAAEVMAEAILRAVRAADSAYGCIAAKDLKLT